MNYKSFILSVLFLAALALQGQDGGSVLKGEITYVTANSVYVRMQNTRQVQIGDSLFQAGFPKACLKVNAKSSRSLVCEIIGDFVPEKGMQLSYTPAPELEPEPELLREEETEPEPVAVTEAKTDEPEFERKEVIRGRISASSYQLLASDRRDRNRLMSRGYLHWNNINHSRFSFVAQANYRQIFQAQIERPTQYFNVYNLALLYDAPGDWHITLGRRINPKIASLGAIDGLQVEKSFGQSYVGAIAGSRPDIITFAPNLNLLEYGGYLGRESRGKNLYAQTTAGFIEQRNGGRVDRRYAYFQHSSTLFRRLSLFSSAELDLYQAVNGVVTNQPRLTNLYLSATYRLGRKASLMVSYDSRRRILFYETFQTEIEQLLNEDIAREGIRARFNFRPLKYMNVGMSYSQRYQNDRQNKSDNMQASVGYRKLPGIGGRVSVAYNINQSNYLRSNILSARYNRTLVKDKLDMGIYYRMADYVFVNSERIRRQHYYGGRISWHAAANWTIRLSAERADFNQEANYRVYVRLIRRFHRTR